MLALRKRRMADAHPFLRGGFRPFFFGAATWGVIAMLLWLCVLAGQLTLPTRFDAVSWHRHEMLFGFIGVTPDGSNRVRISRTDPAKAAPKKADGSN